MHCDAVRPGIRLWHAPNGKVYFVLPDGDLVRTVDGHDPPPPPGLGHSLFPPIEEDLMPVPDWWHPAPEPALAS